MASYYLLALPASGYGTDAVFDGLSSLLADVAETAQFPIPNFKIGTLDTLVILSEEMSKLDGQFEGVVLKTAETIRGLLEGDEIKTSQQLSVSDCKLKLPLDDGKLKTLWTDPVEHYLEMFQWNARKYRIEKPLTETLSELSQVKPELWAW